MKKIQSQNLKRISGYGVAVAAALGSASAKADIHYFPVDPDQTGTTDPITTNVILSFNLSGDVATDGSHVANEQFYASHEYANNYKPPTTSGGTGTYLHSSKLNFRATGNAGFNAQPLAYGAIIGNYGSSAYPTAQNGVLTGSFEGKQGGNWTSGQEAYIGLKFDNAGTPNYGWAEITTVDAHTITLDGYAYEDSGSGIKAGQTTEPVPEPSQMALFALGAAGVAAFRRRKKVA